jgi:hypothetical protein
VSSRRTPQDFGERSPSQTGENGRFVSGHRFSDAVNRRKINGAFRCCALRYEFFSNLFNRADQASDPIHAPQGTTTLAHPHRNPLTPQNPRSMVLLPPDVRPRSVPRLVVPRFRAKETT